MEQMWAERVPVGSQKRRHGRTSSGGERTRGCSQTWRLALGEEGESQESRMLLTHQMSALEWVQEKMGDEEMEAGPMGITWE